MKKFYFSFSFLFLSILIPKNTFGKVISEQNIELSGVLVINIKTDEKHIQTKTVIL
jgi:hypothetical protein